MMSGEWNTRMEATMNLTGKNKMINKPLLLSTILLSLIAGPLPADETYEVRTFK